MSLEQELHQRANSRCELCTATLELSIYEVKPHAQLSAASSILICAGCLQQLDHPEADPTRWYPLKESIWSEFAPVQVVAYRLLKALEKEPWANDLLSQIYLDEAVLSWAEAGRNTEESSRAERVLDSNGSELHEGDTVTLIKDLDVKGANFTAKRGTTVKGISLTDDPRYIEGKVNGTRIVLVAAYLKKA